MSTVFRYSLGIPISAREVMLSNFIKLEIFLVSDELKNASGLDLEPSTQAGPV